MKWLLVGLVAANAAGAFVMARQVKRDFRTLDRVSIPVAIWTGVEMRGHAVATFIAAWLDRNTLYTASRG